MFVKNLSKCQKFIANDGCEIQELLHPENDPIDLPYSLAIATVAQQKSTYRHKLKQTEIYYILSGQGLLHIDEEQQTLNASDVAVIPGGSVQWIENTGNDDLLFAAIVSPPWSSDDDKLLTEAKNKSEKQNQ